MGNIESAKYLLNNGASWMVNDAFGKTAEEQAAVLERTDILDIIKEAASQHTQPS